MEVRLCINEGLEGILLAPDTCSGFMLGNSVADCRTLTVITTNQGGYMPGGQLQQSEEEAEGHNSHNVCFTYLQLETAVDSLTCGIENITMDQLESPAYVGVPPSPETVPVNPLLQPLQISPPVQAPAPAPATPSPPGESTSNTEQFLCTHGPSALRMKILW